MIFLIEYNRRKGKILKLKSFPASEQNTAENERLDRELSLIHSGLDHEVVLLEANSEEALRQTHRRYFESLVQIAESQVQKNPLD
jgi:hypothetical protein